MALGATIAGAIVADGAHAQDQTSARAPVSEQALADESATRGETVPQDAETGRDDTLQPDRTYVRAVSVDRPAPRFPGTEALKGSEGWVILSVVVDEDGGVIEPMIEDSSGNEGFEREALRAVRRWRYQPALLNGEPVEQAMTKIRMVFQLEDIQRPGASRSFVRSFREIQALIQDGDLEEANERLLDLRYSKRKNLYEDAWFWWLRYSYLNASGTGDREEKAESLRRALGYQEDYLPADIFVAAAQSLYIMQIEDNDISGALTTFKRLRDSNQAKKSELFEQVLARLEPHYESVLHIVSGDGLLATPAEVGRYGYWVHDLLRRSFALGDVQGRLELVDIRCERATSRYPFLSEDNTWTVPDSWGDCGVYIKGEQGATFTFFEMQPEPDGA